ncbi:tail assembly protein [Comamonas aquatica]|uniref:tail assembly protein n=1 Tax=Comamonas aquatica TaxID=225991 RepID=UPI00244B7A97|nr:tail assembly protein [Comamonas aquatica]MDH0899693.1 tail assembly protein [Comamonas aquatica]
MKTVMLYGFLGRQFGRVHRYDVKTPAEAVKALSVTLQGFRKALVDGGAYRVLVGGKSELDRTKLCEPVSDRETIRIVPVVAGAGRGFGQIILGAAIIGAAFFTGGASIAAGGFLSAGITTTFWGGIAVGIGSSLVLGGVSQMLFSPKQTQGTVDRPENKPSFAFDGAVNTVAQGNPVPVFYGGPLIVGSQVISAGLSAEQI